jgi:DNA-binding transcriptional LysR family regulator
MDINKIRYFAAVAESQHIRKAAEVLNINPATLSRAMKLLEQEAGFRLIVSSGRGIQVTDKGMRLYRQSKALLREFEEFQLIAKNETFPEEKPLRLGSMEVFTTYFLSRFIEQDEKDQRLRVLYLTPGKIEDSLNAREIDVGITYIRLAETDLDYLKVGEFRMAIFGQKSMLTKKFADLPFAVPIDGVDTPAVSLRSLDGWPSAEFPRQVKYELELLETALQFARQGKAVLYCPDFVAKFHNEQMPAHLRLHEVALPGGFRSKKLPIYIVRRRNDEETPFIRGLARLARSLSPAR